MSRQTYIVVQTFDNGRVRFVCDNGIDINPTKTVAEFRVDPFFDALVDCAERMTYDVANIVATYACRDHRGWFTVVPTTEAMRKYRGVNVKRG